MIRYEICVRIKYSLFSAKKIIFFFIVYFLKTKIEFIYVLFYFVFFFTKIKYKYKYCFFYLKCFFIRIQKLYFFVNKKNVKINFSYFVLFNIHFFIKKN